jgi:hypothetical protein
VVSKAHLALLPKVVPNPRPRSGSDAASAHWVSVYDFLPWEDLRNDASRATLRRIVLELHSWVSRAQGQRGSWELHTRIERLFSTDTWNEEEVAERWALISEARLVAEVWRDRWGRQEDAAPRLLFGRPLAFDHRSMLADALARLRANIKSIPEVVDALMDPPFTLGQLQTAYEAIGGRPLYHSNFRRVMAQSRAFVESLGEREEPRGPGKPAYLYRLPRDSARGRVNPPLTLPWRKPDLDR